PTYYHAGQTSVLRDSVAAEPVLGRGFQVTQTGPVAETFDQIAGQVSIDIGPVKSMFEPEVQARQASATYQSMNEGLLLVSSTNLCANLAVQGGCPTQTGQIIVSRVLASLNSWHIGQQIRLVPWGTMTITGTYTPPAANADYWSPELTTYFPYEYTIQGPSVHQVSQYDALFTAESTILKAPQDTQGTLVLSDNLDVDKLTPDAVPAISNHVNMLLEDSGLQFEEAIPTGTIPTTMIQVRSAWRSLEVSVLVVTLELVAVAALLLWILVTDATSARGPEIALAKLRGYGRLRLITFALSEDAVLMVASIPVGVLIGWAAATGIGNGLLRPGTPIDLPPLGWVAGAAAALGGLLAVAAGIRPTLRRSVMEQWRRSNQRPVRPSWTFDAIVITAAVAGLAEVGASGSIDSAHQHPIALLVPGLIGLSVAVVAARLLPLVCALAAARGRSGPAMFLALRQLARRPGATRTTTVLATAFALAAFALSAWSLARTNSSAVAAAQVGAPTVLQVNVPNRTDLSAVVHQADPSGRHATPVEEYFSDATTTLAVNPADWGRIALRGNAGPTLNELEQLHPAEPAPLPISGDSIRLDVTTDQLKPAGSFLVATLVCPGSNSSTPVQLPTPPASGTAQLVAPLPCAGVLDGITAETPPQAFSSTPIQGSVTINGIDTGSAGNWKSVPTASLGVDRWYAGISTIYTAPSGTGFTWLFKTSAASATVEYRDRPFPLPAIAASAVIPHPGGFAATGLNGDSLPVNVIATPETIPGSPGTGVIVDLDYARLAAQGNVSPTQSQVWVSGNPAPIEAALRHAGIAIGEVSTSAQVIASLRRTGPGLADTLFLAEAGAAAALAAGTAIVALYLLARRRRYELAALLTAGLSRKRLTISMLVEQLILVAYGALIGIAAGLISAVVLLRDVPEFTTPPLGVHLASFPPGVPIIPVLVAGFVVVLGAAAVAAVRLVAGTELTQLREAPA
ncbi:MAG TPA: FtsX-like permease family protein, partial [Acidimicrobiales bacterium]|nr:FtsX-like permease family protein [Acidimicrobiales bacterium]